MATVRAQPALICGQKADPVPASSLKVTQRKSGDRVRLPDLQITASFLGSHTALELSFYRLQTEMVY